MVFGPLIGAGLGALAGVGIGSAVFSGDRPKDFGFITEAADRNDNIRTPAAANITDEMRSIIPLTPEWTYWPDYERWMMINRLIRLMWPKLTTAILKQVIGIVKPLVQNALNAIPSALGRIDDITLGPYSLMDAEHLDPHIADKYFSLGDHPVRVAGMKVYHTTEDTCIFETPVIWGSNMVFDVQVYLRLGPFRIVVPISISHLQFKVISRIILNMVDTIPCIGGATVSLLDVPHVDYRLAIFNGPDIMALPGINFATRYLIKWVMSQLMLYPNSVSVPLMTNFGIPDEPEGMVHVTLQKIEGLKSTDFLSKGDPYVVFEIREGRQQRSKIVKNDNNAVFNEEFFMVVDDFVKQKLSIKVYDYDRMCPTDDLLGTAEVYFSEETIDTDPKTGGQQVVYKLADWIKDHPMTEKKLIIPLQLAGGGLLKSLGKSASGAVTGAMKTAKSLVSMKRSDALILDDNKTYIRVAKTAKEARLEEEKKRAAEAAEAAAKAAADKAAAEKAAASKALPAGTSAAAAEAVADKIAVARAEDDWTEADEKALWAEWKKINAEKKAADAAETKRRKALTKEQRAAEDAARKAEEATAKAEEEKIELVEQEVQLRGNGKVMPAGTKSVGDLFITVEFMPFDKPHFDDDIELKPLKSGLSAYIPFEPPPAREILTNVNDFQKGLLTVTIFKGSALGKPGVLTAPDPYIEMILVDCDRKRPSEVQKSTVKNNDSTPRWIETFDFVFISAGSMLTLNVWDKVSMLDAVASLKLSTSRFQDTLLGKVQVPVADVARNGHLKDTWALQDAESGTIEMKLQWQNCYVDEYID